MKIIDLDNYNRKETFNYFKTFSNPCYGITSMLDITKLYKKTKKDKSSFFINMLYLLMISLNSIEEFRTRYINEKLVVFDKINPSFTVMTNLGCFDNCSVLMNDDYQTFYQECKNKIEECKNETKIKEGYNNDTYDEYYITCLPWLNFESMSHPFPSNDHTNSSVPRICWGKYFTLKRKVYLRLNISVSHMIVDGYPLSLAFNTLQDNLNKADFLLNL